MDEQLRRCRQSQALFSLSNLYLVVLCLCVAAHGVQLLLLLVRRLRVQHCLGAAGSAHDGPLRVRLFVHVKHANECHVWTNDGDRDH